MLYKTYLFWFGATFHHIAILLAGPPEFLITISAFISCYVKHDVFLAVFPLGFYVHTYHTYTPYFGDG